MSSGHRGSLSDENGEGKDGYVNVYNKEDMHEPCHVCPDRAQLAGCLAALA